MMKLKLIVALAAVAAIAAIPAQAGPPSTSTSAVRMFSDTSIVGSSTLRRQSDSLQMTLQTSGLPAGHVVTVWWIIFNHPAFCQFGEAPNPATGFAGTTCGAGDLGIVPGLTADPRVEPAVMHAAGQVIGANGTGNYGSYLSVGSTREQILLGSGLTNPLGADIHLLVHDHAALSELGNVGEEIGSIGEVPGADLQFAAHEAS